jgi:hypothetical protein
MTTETDPIPNPGEVERGYTYIVVALKLGEHTDHPMSDIRFALERVPGFSHVVNAQWANTAVKHTAESLISRLTELLDIANHALEAEG